MASRSEIVPIGARPQKLVQTPKKCTRETVNQIHRQVTDIAGAASSSSTKKRKHARSHSHDEKDACSHSSDEDEDEVAAAIANAALALTGSTPAKRSRKKNEFGEPEEKRLRIYRKKAPKTFLDRLDRVRTQRMFLIDRQRSISEDRTHEKEVFDIAGTTGNIYQVTISKQSSCTCPDCEKGNQCKHIIYVMINVLKAPEHLSYQLALLSTELTEIFSAAPVTPQSQPQGSTVVDTSVPGKRKPVEGDCPVCVMEFEEGDDIVWCKAACGNNIHQECFRKWSLASKGKGVKCVYCRMNWIEDKPSKNSLNKAGEKNDEGYVNIGAQLGLDSERDMSSYNPFWVHQQSGYRGRGSHNYYRGY